MDGRASRSHEQRDGSGQQQIRSVVAGGKGEPIQGEGGPGWQANGKDQWLASHGLAITNDDARESIASCGYGLGTSALTVTSMVTASGKSSAVLRISSGRIESKGESSRRSGKVKGSSASVSRYTER